MSGKKYDGAYVPADGTYGLRLELKGKHFVLLWRNSPVLETKFTVSDDGSFKLSDSELRYCSLVNDLGHSPSKKYDIK